MEVAILDRPKVFSVGFHCSGTKLLRSAFHSLGYSVVGGFGARRPRIHKFYLDRCINNSYGADAFVGDPWPVAYRQMDCLWPNAKFILTTCDAQKWLRDIQAALGRSLNPPQKLALGVDDLFENEAAVIERFHAHEKEVRGHFANQPERLLVVDLLNGNGGIEAVRAFLSTEPTGAGIGSNDIRSAFHATQPRAAQPFHMALAGE